MADKIIDQALTEDQRLRKELGLPDRLPDHTELPDSDGDFVKNFQEHPQSILLTESIWPLLDARHPDGHFTIGQDSGIYWRLTEPDEPAYKGAVSPDWYYVPDVPPTLDGVRRRSYVLWQEHQLPYIILEFVSGDGSEERDRTVGKGKFWIYEQAIRPLYYGIFFGFTGELEFYALSNGGFKAMEPNERKHFAIPDLDIEFGVWSGRYHNVKAPWLRIWDSNGSLLLTGNERAQRETERAELATEQAEKLAAKLRELGVNPDEIV